jgi:hypothetical protein
MFNAISAGAGWLFRASCAAFGAVVILTAMGSSAGAFTGISPEIDPGSLSSAMTLLVGSALYIMGRRAKL